MKPFNYEECMKEHGGYAVNGHGEKVRLICDNLKDSNGYSIVGASVRQDGMECLQTFNKEGMYSLDKNSPHNLYTPAKRIKREYWVNVYPNGLGDPKTTKTAADSCVGFRTKRIACIKFEIDCEEGEGI